MKNPAQWPDGTPRSQRNAFDWKNYEPMCKWSDPNKSHSKLAPMPPSFSISKNPKADAVKTAKILRGGI